MFLPHSDGLRDSASGGRRYVHQPGLDRPNLDPVPLRYLEEPNEVFHPSVQPIGVVRHDGVDLALFDHRQQLLERWPHSPGVGADVVVHEHRCGLPAFAVAQFAARLFLALHTLRFTGQVGADPCVDRGAER